MIPSFAQTQTTTESQITISTDKSTYQDGDKIAISGTVKKYSADTPVTIHILDPKGEIVEQYYVGLESGNTFSTSLIANSELLWHNAGIYQVIAYFGSVDKSQTTFQFIQDNTTMYLNKYPSSMEECKTQLKTLILKIAQTDKTLTSFKVDFENMYGTNTILDDKIQTVSAKIDNLLSYDNSLSSGLLNNTPLDEHSGNITDNGANRNDCFNSLQQYNTLFYKTLESVPKLEAKLNFYQNPSTVFTSSDVQITMHIDKASYEKGETIKISGTAKNYDTDTKVSGHIVNPLGVPVTDFDTIVQPDGTYSVNIVAAGEWWNELGTYALESPYLNTTFQLVENTKDTSQTVIPTSTLTNSTTVPTTPAKIPNWVKGVFNFYAEGKLSDNDLINALQFLIQQGIIKVS